MPTLSLTDFVQFVSASGTPRITKVRQIKERGEYKPATDYYRQLRHTIVDCHRSEGSKSALDDIVEKVHPKKEGELSTCD